MQPSRFAFSIIQSKSCPPWPLLRTLADVIRSSTYIDLPQIEARLVEEGFYFPEQLRAHLQSGVNKKQ